MISVLWAQPSKDPAGLRRGGRRSDSPRQRLCHRRRHDQRHPVLDRQQLDQAGELRNQEPFNLTSPTAGLFKHN